MTIKQIKAYSTSDGETFNTYHEALIHQTKQDFYKDVSKDPNWIYGQLNIHTIDGIIKFFKRHEKALTIICSNHIKGDNK